MTPIRPKYPLLLGLFTIINFIGGYYLFNNKAIRTPLPAPLPAYSSFVDKKFIEQAWAQNKALPPKTTTAAAAVIVPHHLLATDFIIQALETVAQPQPTTIVLISPNHFNAGTGQVITSLADWVTPYGNLETNDSLIEALRRKGLVSIEPEPFKKEHGIGNLVGFIKKVFPRVQFVPLIIKDAQKPEQSQELATALNDLLPNHSLIIASLDMSHYLPLATANFHDAATIATLNNFDLATVDRLDTDSQPSIRMLLNYLQTRNSLSFYQINHGNAAEITGNLTISETTSYITGYFGSGKTKVQNIATVLMTGSINPKNIEQDIPDNHSLENPLLRLLQGNDITENWLTETTDNYRPLQQRGFNLNLSADSEPVVKNIRGISVGFITYNQNQSNNLIKTLERIKSLRSQCRWLVVSASWGNKSATNQNIAHQLIAAGADAVVGSGGQRIEPLELYNTKPIFYNLGTIDQTAASSLTVGFLLTPEKMITYLFPLEYANSLRLPSTDKRVTILNDLAQSSSVSTAIRQAIQDGQLNN